MLRLKLEPDEDTAPRLIKCAASEPRPVPWQAELLLRQALGLAFPYPCQGSHVGETEASLQHENTAEVDS